MAITLLLSQKTAFFGAFYVFCRCLLSDTLPVGLTIFAKSSMLHYSLSPRFCPMLLFLFLALFGSNVIFIYFSLHGLFFLGRHIALFSIATHFAHTQNISFRPIFTILSPFRYSYIQSTPGVRALYSRIFSFRSFMAMSHFHLFIQNTLFYLISHRCAPRPSYPTLFIYLDCS